MIKNNSVPNTTNNSTETLPIAQRILNKITRENFQVLIDQFVSKCQLLEKDEAILILNNLFQKVVEEPSTPLQFYTQIAIKIDPIFNQRLSLLSGNIYVDLFNKESNQFRSKISLKSEITTEEKQHIINCSRFMGECYRNHILPPTFLNDVSKQYFPPSDYVELTPLQLLEIEILANIFTMIGKSVEGPQTSADVLGYLQIALEQNATVINNLIENRSHLPPRIRFMIKNLIELKNNKWTYPKSQNDDIFAQKEILKLASAQGKIVCKILTEKCESDESLHTIFWRSFFQSMNTQNYKILNDLLASESANLSPSNSPTVPLSPFLRRSMVLGSPVSFSLGATANSNHNSNNNNSMEVDSFDINEGIEDNNHNLSNFNLNSSLPASSTSTPMNTNTNIGGKINLQNIHLFNNVLGGNNLPNGFVSPKIARTTSPTLSSTTQTIISNQDGGFNQQQLSQPQQQLQQPSGGASSGNSLTKIKESPELSNLPESNLSLILSIIDSKIWNPQKDVWKKKIMNKIIPMKSSLNKSQKIEILAAIWQNMCDNHYEYGSYLDLCLLLVKLDEGEMCQELFDQPPVPPVQQQPPPQQFTNAGKPEDLLLNRVKNPHTGNRRSSMAVIQLKSNNSISSPSIESTRRSSIAVPSELTRRGSLSCDIPSSCPPAPKLKSTPTLKSTPLPINPNAPKKDATPIIPSQKPNVEDNLKKSKQPPVAEENKKSKQPSAKKHKPDSDTFKDVLISSLQDDFALKMFVKKRSLTVYMELLKDLYREFIIEIPLLLKCISLVHNGLYELTDEECTLLFDLEEMAQEQQNLEKLNTQHQNLLKQNNQVFQWKTNTWEEKPQDPPPPPNSFFDLTSDVFVL
ncbi:hypothetical protein CYY_009704 [Polysphondylium violaceum]|uniref:MIF4G domain-containing protein n=1 Tax=Polysphondylium violaceum TaxID=133409 RepID=A0A8J4PKU9_9MYCE|nr:hypothetical protein CYY_009704 [Polysphondylium violaceum]